MRELKNVQLRGLNNDMIGWVPKALNQKKIAHNGCGHLIENENGELSWWKDGKPVCVDPQSSNGLVNPVVSRREGDCELADLGGTRNKFINAGLNGAGAMKSL